MDRDREREGGGEARGKELGEFREENRERDRQTWIVGYVDR